LVALFGFAEPLLCFGEAEAKEERRSEQRSGEEKERKGRKREEKIKYLCFSMFSFTCEVLLEKPEKDIKNKMLNNL
jgi:hypothetical protein